MTQQPPFGSDPFRPGPFESDHRRPRPDARFGGPFTPPPGAPQQTGPFGPPPSAAPPTSAPERPYAPPSAAPPPSAQAASGFTGHYGAPQPPTAQHQPEAPKPKKSRKALAAALITGASVAVIAVPLGIAIGWFMQTNQYFEQAAVEAQVEQVLADDYGLAEVSEVSCPAEVKPEQATSFECTYTLNGSTQSVPVTVGSDDGQLLVGSPAGEE